MDFETAVSLSHELEQSFDRLVISGFRRTSAERIDSWAVDVVDPDTGRLASIDEKDDWERLMEVAFPELTGAR